MRSRKPFALATLLSSFLVAAVALADYFMTREMDQPSLQAFWISALLESEFVLLVALLPAALSPPTLLRSIAAVVISSFVGTLAAVAIVVLKLWGSLLYLDGAGGEILFQLRALLVPAAISVIIGALWRQVRRTGRQGPAAP